MNVLADRVIKARRASICHLCHGHIMPGQQIGHTAAGWNHTVCIRHQLARLMRQPPRPRQ